VPVFFLLFMECIMIQFQLPDMTCGHCSKTVTNTAQQVEPGVQVDITFAVPADWSAYNTFDDTTNQEIANHLETDVTSIQNSTRLMDLMTLAPARDDLGVMEGVFCMKLTLPLDATTIESTVRKSASNSGGNVDVFTSTESANGTVYYGIVSSPDNYALVGHVYLPNSSGSYVTTYIYASSTERLQALISSVATTLR